MSFLPEPGRVSLIYTGPPLPDVPVLRWVRPLIGVSSVVSHRPLGPGRSGTWGSGALTETRESRSPFFLAFFHRPSTTLSETVTILDPGSVTDRVGLDTDPKVRRRGLSKDLFDLRREISGVVFVRFRSPFRVRGSHFFRHERSSDAFIPFLPLRLPCLPRSLPGFSPSAGHSQDEGSYPLWEARGSGPVDRGRGVDFGVWTPVPVDPGPRVGGKVLRGSDDSRLVKAPGSHRPVPDVWVLGTIRPTPMSQNNPGPVHVVDCGY